MSSTWAQSFLFYVLGFRADNGRDETKSGAGEREVGDRGEEADGAGEATSS